MKKEVAKKVVKSFFGNALSKLNTFELKIGYASHEKNNSH